MNGILNVLKPPGMTSHDVVSLIRRKTGIKKVGHTGTLDPNAAGVLPICVGQATKVSQFLLDSDKEYRAELTLGIETDTQDIYGEKIKESPVNLSKKDIESAIISFVGSYNQVPPMYSAIKVRGKKLYNLARQGIEVERKSRQVDILKINIIKITENKVLFDVLCSKGTYIRTLCKDIGDLLNCGATMSFLLRTKSSNFDLNSSVTIEELKDCPSIDKYLFPLDYPLQYMPKVMVKNAYKKRVENGHNILYEYLIDGPKIPLESKVRVYIEEKFIGFGIVKPQNNNYYIKLLRLFV